MKKINILIYILLVFFMLSLCTFIFSTIYSPFKVNSLKNIDLKFKDYSDLKQNLKKLEKKYSDWKKIESEYHSGKNKFYMRFDGFSKFRRNLKSNFNKFGLDENGLKVDYKKILKGEFIRSSVKFQISGSYEKIKKMIFELQKIDKLIFIKNLRIFRRNGNRIFCSILLEVILVP